MFSEEILAKLQPVAGTYVFRYLDSAYWQPFSRVREALGTIYRELHDDQSAGRWSEIVALMPIVDRFSCNLGEARALFGSVTPEGAAYAMLASAGYVAAKLVSAIGFCDTEGSPQQKPRVQMPCCRSLPGSAASSQV